MSSYTHWAQFLCEDGKDGSQGVVYISTDGLCVRGVAVIGPDRFQKLRLTEFTRFIELLGPEGALFCSGNFYRNAKRGFCEPSGIERGGGGGTLN